MSLALSIALNIIAKFPESVRDLISMRIPPIKNDPSKIQLVRLGHVRFEHADLEQFREFAIDFGFVEEKAEEGRIYYRGYGIDPFLYIAEQSKTKTSSFLGPAFVAASQAEFDKAAALPGARLGSLEDAPGGGQIVTFERSDETLFHVIFGQKERQRDGDMPSAIHDEVGPMNTPYEKPRKGKFQRFHEGPALIHKLGHMGYVYRDFDNEIKWYTGNFNFVPSDVLYHWDLHNVDALTFMHLDLGKAYSDHHILFLQRATPETKKSFMHHSSYEVEDFDTQLIGHQYLAKKGWKSVWGVGRHVLGSQIFDYWQDPSGFKIEHYADGDQVNEDTPMKRDVIGPFSIWGPEVPHDFPDNGIPG